MPEASLSQSAPLKPGPKTTTLTKLILGGIVLCLLGIAYVEQNSYSKYSSSRQALELWFRVNQQSQQDISSTNLERFVSGFASKQEEKTNDQLNAIRFRWPSIWNRYEIVVLVDDHNSVTAIESSRAPDEKKQPAEKSFAVSTLTATKPEDRILPARGLPKSTIPAVALQRDSSTPVPPNSDVGRLTRELIRQSFLITARDEFRLSTLDAALGESVDGAEAPDSFPFDIHVVTQNQPGTANPSVIEFRITRPASGNQWYEWISPPIPLKEGDFLEELVDVMEGFSRSEFVKVLTDAGFQKPSLPSDPLETTTELKLKDQQFRFDILSQYLLLRQLHGEIKELGESPDRLAGLVLSYANLGSLTEYHWSVDSKVFKARSLLYAQRLITKYKNNTNALACRAYSRALAGRHNTALSDISSVNSVKGFEPPSWLKLVSLYCEFKPELLEKSDAAEPEAAAYFAMLISDQEFDEQNSLDRIETFSKANRLCTRVPDELAKLAKHTSGGRGFTGFDECWISIYKRLTKIEGLSNPALEAAEELAKSGTPRSGIPPKFSTKRVALCQSLKSAGEPDNDTNPCSWAILGQLFLEDLYCGVWRGIEHYEIMMENTPPTTKKSYPLVAGHPFENWVKCFSMNRQETAAAIVDFLKTIDAKYLEPQTWAMIDFYNRKAWAPSPADITEVDRVTATINSHREAIWSDLPTKTLGIPPRHQAEKVAAISARSPLATQLAIDEDLTYDVTQLAAWEKEFPENPRVLRALAFKYQLKSLHVDKLRCLKRAVEVAPSFKSYEELANEYERLGDKVARLEALEKSLELPDIGLEAARVRVDIAKAYFETGNFVKARQLAKVAASSGAGWAMQMAAQCAERLEDWDEAEQYIRDVSAYDNAVSAWYFWCVRTNHGDRDEAMKYAKRKWKSLSQPWEAEQYLDRAIAYLLEDDPNHALEMLDEVIKQKDSFGDTKTRSNIVFVLAGLIADKLGDTARRDQYFHQAVIGRNRISKLYELLNLFLDAARTPNEFHWSPQSFDMLQFEIRPDEATNVYFLAGTFLQNHGEKQLSEEYLRNAATSANSNSRACLLATYALRSQSLNVGEIRSTELTEAIGAVKKILVPAKEEYELRTVLDSNRDSSSGPQMYLRSFSELQDKLFEEFKGNFQMTQVVTSVRSRLEKFDTATSDQAISKAISQQPGMAAIVLLRGKLREGRGDYEGAIADYESILSNEPMNQQAQECLAELLATCEQAKFRNGDRALALAQQLFDRQEFKLEHTRAALAKAYAECGQFDNAIEALKEPLKDMMNLGYYDYAKQLYQNKKPYRRPMPEPKKI